MQGQGGLVEFFAELDAVVSGAGLGPGVGVFISARCFRAVGFGVTGSVAQADAVMAGLSGGIHDGNEFFAFLAGGADPADGFILVVVDGRVEHEPVGLIRGFVLALPGGGQMIVDFFACSMWGSSI